MKKLYFAFCFIVCLFACTFLLWTLIEQSPSEFLAKHCDLTIDEVIAQEKVEDLFLIFFSSNRKICCAILEKKPISFQLVCISNGLFPTYANSDGLFPTPNYLFSGFFLADNYNWIDWGILTNKNILYVLAGDAPMSIISDIPYDYRICWILGCGTDGAPPDHMEIYK